MNKITDRSVCRLCLCELNVFHRSDLKHVNFNPHKTRSYKQLTNHICLTVSVRRTCFTFSENPSNKTDSRESGDDWMLLNDYIAIKNHTHWLHMTIIRSFHTPNDVYKSERCFAFIIYSHGCSFPQWSTYRCFPVLRCWFLESFQLISIYWLVCFTFPRFVLQWERKRVHISKGSLSIGLICTVY